MFVWATCDPNKPPVPMKPFFIVRGCLLNYKAFVLCLRSELQKSPPHPTQLLLCCGAGPRLQAVALITSSKNLSQALEKARAFPPRGDAEGSFTGIARNPLPRNSGAVTERTPLRLSRKRPCTTAARALSTWSATCPPCPGSPRPARGARWCV